MIDALIEKGYCDVVKKIYDNLMHPVTHLGIPIEILHIEDREIIEKIERHLKDINK